MSLTITFYNNIKYTKDDFMSRERDFFGNGVVRLDDFPLTFAPEAPMTVQVGAGVAWVDGYRIENAGAAISLMFAAASAQPRIDIVQIGHDDDLSQAVLQVKQGVPGAVPIEPGADPGYFKLYAVRVNVGATSVTEADIIDCRALVPLNVSGTQINLDGAASTGTNMFTGTQTAPKFVATGQTPLQVQDLTALPTVGPKGTTCVVGGLWHVSDGTAWKAMSPNEYTHPATHPASMITVEDAGDLYTATHVEGVLEELFTSVSDGKATIATAITGKKGTVAGTAPHTFQQLVDGINGIKTGQGNAVEAQVLQGVTFTNQDGVLRTGTMPNKTGSQSAALAWSNTDANTSVHVKPAKGYYDGTDATMVSISDSALVPSNIRSGKTIFGVNGTLLSQAAPKDTVWTVPFNMQLRTPGWSDDAAQGSSGLGLAPAPDGSGWWEAIDSLQNTSGYTIIKRAYDKSGTLLSSTVIATVAAPDGAGLYAYPDCLIHVSQKSGKGPTYKYDWNGTLLKTSASAVASYASNTQAVHRNTLATIYNYYTTSNVSLIDQNGTIVVSVAGGGLAKTVQQNGVGTFISDSIAVYVDSNRMVLFLNSSPDGTGSWTATVLQDTGTVAATTTTMMYLIVTLMGIIKNFAWRG